MVSRILIAFSLAALSVGCGSDDAAGGGGGPGSVPATTDGCQFTLTGAVSQSGRCLVYWHQIEANVDPEPYIGATSTMGYFGFDIYDVQPQTGTYSSGNGLRASALAVGPAVAGQPLQQWQLSENTPGLPTLGSYTATVTAISDGVLSRGVMFWEIDGSVTAQLLPEDGTGAQGELTLRLDF